MDAVHEKAAAAGLSLNVQTDEHPHEHEHEHEQDQLLSADDSFALATPVPEGDGTRSRSQSAAHPHSAPWSIRALLGLGSVADAVREAMAEAQARIAAGGATEVRLCCVVFIRFRSFCLCVFLFVTVLFGRPLWPKA